VQSVKTLKATFKKNPPLHKDLVGRKTLLLGETNSGKTRFTFNFLCHLLEEHSFEPTEISVLEFAPTRVQAGQTVIGGTLRDLIQESTPLTPSFMKSINSVHWIQRESSDPCTLTPAKILTPRYSAKSTQDVLKACCVNFSATQKQLLYYIQNPTKVLIINDIGIYLHLGGLPLLKKAIGLSKTTLFNAYLGKNLLDDKGSYISRREEIMLRLLSKDLDTYLCEAYLQ
jgi:hypothetical protein